MSARVLIIEDEPRDFELLRGAFEETEYEVEWATTGEDGLTFVRHNPIDGAVVDLTLKNSHYGGMSFVTKCRQEGRHFPVVIVTNMTIEAARVRYGSIFDHADDYVEKELGTDWLWKVRDKLRNKITPRWMFVSPPYRLDRVNELLYIDHASYVDIEQPVSLGRPGSSGAPGFRVLECLMGRSGAFVSKADLHRLTREDADPEEFDAKAENRIEKLMSTLRDKIDRSKMINPIETQGNRYRWRLPDRAVPELRKRGGSLRVGGCQLEMETKSLIVLRKRTRVVDLEPVECRILAYLMGCAGVVRSRARIHEGVYGNNDMTPLRELDRHIWSLKRKTDGPDDEPVRHIEGTGCFYFSATEEADGRTVSES